MKKGILVAGALTILATALSAKEWAVKAVYVDACACNVICPCLFGSASTERECRGQGLIRVTEGHYGDVDLSGVTVHHAYKMDAWDRYIVSDKATEEQMTAMLEVLKAGFQFSGTEIVSYTQGPVTFKRSENEIVVTAKNSELKMEVVPGADGKPMRIVNHPRFSNYRQYRSATNKHTSEHADFAITGKNAFIANVAFSSED